MVAIVWLWSFVVVAPNSLNRHRALPCLMHAFGRRACAWHRTPCWHNCDCHKLYKTNHQASMLQQGMLQSCTAHGNSCSNSYKWCTASHQASTHTLTPRRLDHHH